MSGARSRQKYEELFNDDRSKAEAFDKIAEQYYMCNFGSMQKSDLDVLMFSIYIERILKRSEDDESTYSDYTLSKELGITQSRVSTLKVKKELKYPYEGFDWKRSFERVSKNAYYENGKIFLYISDKNLFLELKNAIETNRGFIDVQLNSKLLVVSPGFFIDLLLAVSDGQEREEIRKSVKKELAAKNIDTEYFDKKPVGSIIKDNAASLTASILCDLLQSCVPVCGAAFSAVIKNIINAIRR